MNAIRLSKHVLREIAANLVMGMGPLRRMRVRRGRTTVQDLRLQARQVVGQFIYFRTNLGADRIRNSAVLEIGPGDALPHALLFKAAGASRYSALDRFLADPVSERALAIYRAVIEQARSEGIPTPPIDAADRDDLLAWFRDPGNVTIIPRAAEGLSRDSIAPQRIIFSFNVLEHLSDVAAAMDNLSRLLADDGVMIHRVDYGPHDVWRSYANPLLFLTFPDWLWSAMGSNRGYPNRVRHRAVVNALRAGGLSVEDAVTSRAEDGQWQSFAPTLKRRFGALDGKEIAVLSAEFTAAKAAPVPLISTFEQVYRAV